ncbi:syntaxin binding protein 6 (amisyn), like [Alosa pseudoharengus]|uniref:syntaxin binding protein 6 (amisyn), like n=1 Tax=Alosa pseudoharengus TaxID=34774 RepID=UPI003F8B84B9
MSMQSTINRDIFVPLDQKLLVAIEVKRRNRRKLPFLSAGRKYATFICLSGNVHSLLSSSSQSMKKAVRRASQALGERGDRLWRAEDKTAHMKDSAKRFSDSAHKLALKYSC